MLLITIGYLYPIFAYLGRLKQSGGLSTAQQEGESSIIARMLLAACLSGVALLGTWGTIQFGPTWVDEITGGKSTGPKAYTQFLAGFGAVVGCVLAALAGERFGRRITYAVLCFGSMLSIFAFFQLNTSYGSQLLVCAFFAGGAHRRVLRLAAVVSSRTVPDQGSGDGSRIWLQLRSSIGSDCVMQLPFIMREFKVGYDVACPVISLIYLVGFIVIWFARKRRGSLCRNDKVTTASPCHPKTAPSPSPSSNPVSIVPSVILNIPGNRAAQGPFDIGQYCLAFDSIAATPGMWAAIPAD